MTLRKWLDGYPWNGNGGAFGELACWRISWALWAIALCAVTTFVLLKVAQ